MAAYALRARARTLSNETARELQATLDEICDKSQSLFIPSHPLSGDPNPRNWRLRAVGLFVLFDWERFCFGAPALDLAIIVPGLGNADLFRNVAEAYLSYETNEV